MLTCNTTPIVMQSSSVLFHRIIWPNARSRAYSHCTVAASKVRAGAFSWPLFSKAHKGGEDAFFVSTSRNEENDNNNNNNSNRLLVCAVADGVGGSACPDLFANTLMDGCRDYANKHHSETSPIELLAGDVAALPDLLNIDGSSTVCLVVLEKIAGNNKDGGSATQHGGAVIRMQCANLGDSGYLVFRNGQVVARSTPQLHRPNTPYQLGMGADTPLDAHVSSVMLQTGDMVVVCSDGILDNLFDNHVSLILQGPEALQTAQRTEGEKSRGKTIAIMPPPAISAVEGLQVPFKVDGSREVGSPTMVELAKTLCAHAVHVYSLGKCYTPWAKEWFLSEGDFGKPDDATAIVIEIES